ncbi:GntR family transcriptional regulator [Acholeplasma laidlawii]|uniref:GntR family transcriptional regulator n=1 Tax=Acholeplasma laidlawii TaxID=2148 RepID=UPI0021F6A4C7|nr:GntR family transcriptional regulator [Acholeplasma laidlawii]
MKLDLYMQIKNHYETLIKTGVFKTGDMLPSLRTVAGELGVNPNTVEKAYQELMKDGLIEIIPKKGAFVKGFIYNPSEKLEAQLKVLISELKNFKTKKEIIKLINELLEESHD